MRGGRGGCPLPHFLWVTWRVPGVALAAAEAAPALGGRRRRALPGRRARPGPARPLASQRGEPGPAPAAPGGEGKRRILAGSGGGGGVSPVPGAGVSSCTGWRVPRSWVAGFILTGVFVVVGGSSCIDGSISCPGCSGWRGSHPARVEASHARSAGGGELGLSCLEGASSARGCGGGRDVPHPAQVGGIPCPGCWRGIRTSSCLAAGNPLPGAVGLCGKGPLWAEKGGVPSCPAMFWSSLGMQRAGQLSGVLS